MRHLATLASFGLAAALYATAAVAQQSGAGEAIIPLYSAGTIPSLGVPEIREQREEVGGLLIRNVSEPTLELFRAAPEHANGTAVIVVPGGGFVGLAYDTVGTAVARQLAERGVTALVLKHRTILSPADPTQMPDIHMAEMAGIMARAQSGATTEVLRLAGEAHAVEDGVRALAIVRQRASEWGINPQQVGMLGFSSGAFLAADLAIGDMALRPAFVGLIYGGLRVPVPADAPPAFIAGAADDELLPNDSVQLYTAWRQAGVAAELHVYERGGHGFDLRSRGTTSDHWFDAFIWWMQARDLMRSASARPSQ